MQAKISCGMAVAPLVATTAFAQTPNKFGEEAGWEILVRDDMGPGCLITRSNTDDAGAQVQMGIDATADLKGYLAVYTKADANVSAGQKLHVTFEVDGQKFEGEAKGQESGGYRGAFVWVNNPDFI